MLYSNVKLGVQMLKERMIQVENEPHAGHLATNVNKESISILYSGGRGAACR